MSLSPSAIYVPAAGESPGAATQSSQSPQADALDEQRRALDGSEQPDPTFKELLPNLTKELENELIGLVNELERESFPTWRLMFRETLEAESFWKDIQHGFYDYETDVFRLPTLRDIAPQGQSGQRYEFVTNLYRSLGWTLIAVLGQKLPTCIFLPSDYTNENDVAAARTAGDVVPIIERNNRVLLLHMKAIYYLFTGGIFAAYVRYIVDGERFGFEDKESVSMASYGRCQDCGEYFPVNDSSQPSQACPSCGAENPAESIQTIPMPNLQVTGQTPRGQEVVTLHGLLEMRLPPWVQDREDMPYIGLVNEVHKSNVRATYGDRAKNIEGGFGSEGPYDNWDRFARMSLLEPTVGYYSLSNTNLVTLKRYWLRPKTLYLIKDDQKRQALIDIAAGKGLAVTITETSTLLDARVESLDDHWRICRGMEGHGMFTPPLGHSALSIQKRFNTLMNFIMEWVEYSAAGMGTLVNTGALSVRALASTRRAPGMIFPVRLPVGADLSKAVYTDRPAAIAGEIFQHANDLRGLAQEVTAAVPTVSGGTQKSLKPTTYLADREQGLGKMFLPWQHLRQFWAEIMWLAVKQFAQNRTEDQKYSLPSPTGVDTVNRTVRLDSLSGEFDAYPEVNEKFPRLWSDEQEIFMDLVKTGMNDPVIAGIIGNTRNLPFAKAMFGLPNLYIPGEDDYKKQTLETAQLLNQKPIQTLDPTTGQPVVLPSIMPDEFEDDHLQHENTVKQWAVSAPGVRAKAENPDGYRNVIAHGKAHQEILIRQAMQQMQAMPPGPPGPAGRTPSAQPAHAAPSVGTPGA